jgi:copper(I)-binding protein
MNRHPISAPAQWVAMSVAIALICCAVTSCSSAGVRPTATDLSMHARTGDTASAHIGDLVITGGYIPAPASPDVAAAYLTIVNRGASPDTLVKVTTDVAHAVMPMTESSRGGSGSMTGLGKITIPAHGQFRFTPGHAHLMLERPKQPLAQGNQVRVTLTFSHAGTTRLTLPVVAITGPTTMPSMSGMSQ